MEKLSPLWGDRWGFHNTDYCTMVTFRYLVHLVFSKIAGEANFKSCLHIQTKDMKDHFLCHQRSDNIKKRDSSTSILIKSDPLPAYLQPHLLTWRALTHIYIYTSVLFCFFSDIDVQVRHISLPSLDSWQWANLTKTTACISQQYTS